MQIYAVSREKLVMVSVNTVGFAMFQPYNNVMCLVGVAVIEVIMQQNREENKRGRTILIKAVQLEEVA